jgi:hypothetical protein
VSSSGAPRDFDSISADVRDLVVSDPATLPAVINLLKSGILNIDQQQAIGTGLGKASNICKEPDLKFAGEIQSQLADTPSEEAKLKYAAVTGNKPIRSVAAGAGSTGASGGQTSPFANLGGSSSTFQPFLANSVSNNPTNFFTSSVSGLGGASTTSFVSTTSVTSVSP